ALQQAESIAAGLDIYRSMLQEPLTKPAGDAKPLNPEAQEIVRSLPPAAERSDYIEAVPDRVRSVGILLQRPGSADAPLALRSSQQLIGRRHAAQGIFLNGFQIRTLVVTGTVYSSPPSEPLFGERNRSFCKLQHVGTRNGCGETEPGDLVAQGLPLLCVPALDQIPGCVERVVIVEDAAPAPPHSPPP